MGDYRHKLIGKVHEMIDDERRIQKLSETEMGRRLGVGRVYTMRQRNLQFDLRLSTVARYAHALGKRVVVTFEDNGHKGKD